MVYSMFPFHHRHIFYRVCSLSAFRNVQKAIMQCIYLWTYLWTYSWKKSVWKCLFKFKYWHEHWQYNKKIKLQIMYIRIPYFMFLCQCTKMICTTRVYKAYNRSECVGGRNAYHMQLHTIDFFCKNIWLYIGLCSHYVIF